jgi:predicted nuclease of predicted toxin-antitoxin system
MPDSSKTEELFLRLYFDRHIKKQVAVDLWQRGHDVLTTEEASMDTASDEDQLAFAAKEDRAILTFNIRDFAPLHEQWTVDGKAHAGIIVSQRLGSRHYGVLLSRVLRLRIIVFASRHEIYGRHKVTSLAVAGISVDFLHFVGVNRVRL